MRSYARVGLISSVTRDDVDVRVKKLVNTIHTTYLVFKLILVNSPSPHVERGAD